MTHDKDYIRLINSRQWRSLRLSYLAAHPYCERCLKDMRHTPATQVHHVAPVEWGKTLEDKVRRCYDAGNLMALCQPCHILTHTELRSHTAARSKERRDRETASMIDKLFNRDE